MFDSPGWEPHVPLSSEGVGWHHGAVRDCGFSITVTNHIEV